MFANGMFRIVAPDDRGSEEGTAIQFNNSVAGCQLRCPGFFEVSVDER